jgi:hypothetical protein
VYRVALLLPAQAGQQAGDSSAQHSNSSQETLQTADSDAPSSAAASTDTTAAAVAPAQHSGLRDMLLTVHAEQEVAGQVYLVVSSQLVRAGRSRPANPALMPASAQYACSSS